MAGKRGGEKETTVKTLKRKPANKKDPNAPKKPRLGDVVNSSSNNWIRNAYMFFSNEKRKEVKDANPELRISNSFTNFFSKPNSFQLILLKSLERCGKN